MAKYYSKKGEINLRIMEKKGSNFISWIYQEIRPFLKGSILELGSGEGLHSKMILNDFPKNKIILSDIDIKYVNELKRKFSKPNISIFKVDFGNKSDFEKIKTPIDTVLAINVLEHVKDDIQALKNVYDKLNPGGRLIILVPVHKFLFNCMDKCIGHYRRYTKKEILNKVSKTKFKVKKISYFNFFSIFGWYWNGTIKKRGLIDENLLGAFNRLVPFIRLFEKYILRKKIGISFIVVLEK